MIFTATHRERSGFVPVTSGTGAECKASRRILRRGSRDPPRSAALLFCFFFLNIDVDPHNVRTRTRAIII